MSQTKIDYSKSMIYKLCCKNSNITDIYIGSTTNFKMRKYQHKNGCINENNKDYNNYKYQFIRDNGGFENFDMILIEKVNVDNKRDLEKIERKYIDELKPSLNTINPYTSEKEKKEYSKNWRETNQEYYKEYSKNWRETNQEYYKKYCENNKDKIKENKKIYCENNKDKIKENKKAYYENNKTEINEEKKKYREKNKTEINQKQNQKINCEFCGCLSNKQNIKRHQQTVKCLKFQFIDLID